MTYFIVGHRGTGKTEFLRRIESYYKETKLKVCCIDLDEEIEEHESKPIAEIFHSQGEERFRQLEVGILKSILSRFANQDTSLYISLGAGFSGELPAEAKVIWLRRASDRSGRVFLDRPRLDPEMSPLDEFRSRYMARVARFRRYATHQITLEEGWNRPNTFEKILLGLKPADLGASLTVLPEHMAHEIRFEDFITDKVQLGVRYFELRDDLLTPEQMARCFREIAADRLLFGFRTRDSEKNAKAEWLLQSQYDWALELGPCPWKNPKILSLHYRAREESVEDAIQRLMSAKAQHYKLAIPIDNFEELWEGHKWVSEDPKGRSFLPLSQDGRWWWYRALRGPEQLLNFVSEGEGSSFDQPTLFQWLRVQSSQGPRFAAVLGYPIQHSRTPAEQYDFFESRSMPVVSIAMTEAECNRVSLQVLKNLGLQAAAVTAPLKNTMAHVCGQLLGPAKDLKSVNTIYWSEDWIGANTDVEGLEKVLGNLDLPRNIVVWGGGGTRSTLMRLLPGAQFVRARSGEELFGKALVKNPELLVWAVGRDRQSHCVWPHSEWRPLMVLDLNYAEDSPGREYAQRVGAKYQSGLDMFLQQARAQRKFWQSCENSEKTSSEAPL